MEAVPIFGLSLLPEDLLVGRYSNLTTAVLVRSSMNGAVNIGKQYRGSWVGQLRNPAAV